jgi:hypothetical protein
MADTRIQDAVSRIADTTDRPYGSARDELYGGRRQRRRNAAPREPARAPSDQASPSDEPDPPLVGRRIDVRV